MLEPRAVTKQVLNTQQVIRPKAWAVTRKPPQKPKVATSNTKAPTIAQKPSQRAKLGILKKSHPPPHSSPGRHPQPRPSAVRWTESRRTWHTAFPKKTSKWSANIKNFELVDRLGKPTRPVVQYWKHRTGVLNAGDEEWPNDN